MMHNEAYYVSYKREEMGRLRNYINISAYTVYAFIYKQQNKMLYSIYAPRVFLPLGEIKDMYSIEKICENLVVQQCDCRWLCEI